MQRCLVGIGIALTTAIAPFAHAQDSAPAAAGPLHVLIVGGGPNPANNQVAIESNVRYVSRLLPPETPKRVLFADGKTETRDVKFADRSGEHFRATSLTALDGPSRLEAFHQAVTSLAAVSPDASAANPPSLLLYFTGHGSPARRDFINNRYDMWDRDELTVRRLATEIAALPKGEPVTLVMVECFSGAFGNLLFEGGAPDGAPIDRPICGFFASLPERMAAGCTPEINEADYHDFTSYFFAALSGTDRLGRPVSGSADYNHDGVVGMDEAYAYTLIHDNSIDTPVCTSDVFLRRYVKASEASIFQTSYAQLRAWARPAQLAALEGLSASLKLNGDDRLALAYGLFRYMKPETEDSHDVQAIRFVRLAKSIVLAHLLMTGSDTALKERFTALLRAEAGTPFGKKAGM